jgi:hypothetical protein
MQINKWKNFSFIRKALLKKKINLSRPGDEKRKKGNQRLTVRQNEKQQKLTVVLCKNSDQAIDKNKRFQYYPCCYLQECFALSFPAGRVVSSNGNGRYNAWQALLCFHKAPVHNNFRLLNNEDKGYCC